MSTHLQPRHSRLALPVGLLCWLLSFATGLAADSAPVKEYQVKAAFVLNFVKFVEWPAESFTNAQAPIVIGVLTPDPFNGELARAVEGRKVNGRDLVVRKVEQPGDLNGVHLSFISAAAAERTPETLASLKGKPVLTVGETASFSNQGGMITFVPEGDKLRFEINMITAEAARIKFSAQLLKLAKNVKKELRP